MGSKIWFGNDVHAQWVPCPASGMVRDRQHFSEELQFINGGFWVNRSKASASRYQMDFPVSDSTDYEGIEAFQRFDDGDYGDSFLRFTDPFSTYNLFSANWAAPGLAEQGWKPIYDTTPSFADVNATDRAAYNYPARAAVYSVTAAANTMPLDPISVFTILIPPTGTLFLQWIGSRTGTAVMRVQPFNLDGTYASDVDYNPVATSVPPAFGGSGFSGASYRAVKVYFTRTTSATSTFTVAALWAHMSYTGSAPTITRHYPGGGHYGLAITGDSAPQRYVQSGRHLVGAYFELAEVEAWQ